MSGSEGEKNEWKRKKNEREKERERRVERERKNVIQVSSKLSTASLVRKSVLQTWKFYETEFDRVEPRTESERKLSERKRGDRDRFVCIQETCIGNDSPFRDHDHFLSLYFFFSFSFFFLSLFFLLLILSFSPVFFASFFFHTVYGSFDSNFFLFLFIERRKSERKKEREGESEREKRRVSFRVIIKLVLNSMFVEFRIFSSVLTQVLTQDSLNSKILNLVNRTIFSGVEIRRTCGLKDTKYVCCHFILSLYLTLFFSLFLSILYDRTFVLLFHVNFPSSLIFIPFSPSGSRIILPFSIIQNNSLFCSRK